MTQDSNTTEGMITLNGVKYKLSDFTAGQITIVQQINHCVLKIQGLELDLGQAKMAHNGFIHVLEKSLVNTVKEPEENFNKRA